jgi:uncharacterized protein
LLSFGLAAPTITMAQIAIPPLTGHVTDQTGTLTDSQRASLEQQLTAFEARKGSQIAILMIPTTAPEAIEPYALRVAEQWKLGRKKIDDGAIMVIAKNDRTVRIEVGYGLEGALSDLVSKRIISETLVPKFKQGDFYGGIQVATEQMMQVIAGESLPIPPQSSVNSYLDSADPSLKQIIPLLLIVALGAGIVLSNLFGKLGGSLITGIVVTGLAWLVIGTFLYALLAGLVSMLFTVIGAGPLLYGVGYYSSGGRGVFGRGGSSQGWSGGGGGFGGGGASGRW